MIAVVFNPCINHEMTPSILLKNQKYQQRKNISQLKNDTCKQLTASVAYFYVSTANRFKLFFNDI